MISGWNYLINSLYLTSSQLLLDLLESSSRGVYTAKVQYSVLFTLG